MKLLWLDTETTGLNKEKCDIIQLAGIVIIDGEEKERFNFHCQPINYENIEQNAMDKTGMTIEKLKTFPTAQETYRKFKELLCKYIDQYDKNDKFFIAGHNVKFDLEFVQSFFDKMGDKYCMSFFRHFTVDLMSFCTILHTAGLINLNSWKLEDIATYLNIPFDTNLHDALVDIDLTRKCFCRLAAKYLNFGE